MTDRDRKEFIEYIRDFSKKLDGNKELALDFLSRVGICTKDGKLKEPYLNLRIPRPTN